MKLERQGVEVGFRPCRVLQATLKILASTLNEMGSPLKGSEQKSKIS